MTQTLFYMLKVVKWNILAYRNEWMNMLKMNESILKSLVIWKKKKRLPSVAIKHDQNFTKNILIVERKYEPLVDFNYLDFLQPLITVSNHSSNKHSNELNHYGENVMQMPKQNSGFKSPFSIFSSIKKSRKERW